MQNQQEGHWPKCNIINISFDTSLTREAFYPLSLDNKDVEAVFGAMIKPLIHQAQRLDFKYEGLIESVEYQNHPFTVIETADSDGWPHALVYGSGIHRNDYLMLIFGVSSTGIWMRTTEYRFMLKAVLSAQCGEALSQMLLERGRAAAR